MRRVCIQLKETMLNQWSLLHAESTVRSFNFAPLARCFSPFMLFSCGCKKVAAVPDVTLKAGKKMEQGLRQRYATS